MVKRTVMCLRRVLAAVVVAAWAGGCGTWAVSVGREGVGVVTPMPDARYYKYIPLRYGPGGGSVASEQESSPDTEDVSSEEEPLALGPKLAPSELILTVMRTALDIVRNINKNRSAAKTDRQGVGAAAPPAANVTSPSKTHGRGYMEDDYYDEHHHDTTTTTTPKPAKPRYTDPWAGYYDFIINEGSFKFWSAFQLFTAALLLYACFSAIYYAKFNPIIPDYDREYDDYFLERSMGRKARSLDDSVMPSGLSWINSQTFQFIMDAIAKNYELSE